MATKVRYPAYANWKVTTEGDCEGKTVRDLGTHTGFIDEIAFKLGRQAYYSLSFQRISDVLEKKPDPEPVRSVSINLAIDSGTWDMSAKERARYVAEILQGRPVEVKEGTYYASVILNKLEVS